MLIGALLVIACGLIIAGALTGVTAYAVAALVLSLAGGVLYVVALRRIGPAVGDEPDDQADDAAADEVAATERTSTQDKATARPAKTRTAPRDKAAGPGKSRATVKASAKGKDKAGTVSTTKKTDTRRADRPVPEKQPRPVATAPAPTPTDPVDAKPAAVKTPEKPTAAKDTEKPTAAKAAVQEAPVQDAAVQEAPVQDAPVQDAPAKDAPAKDAEQQPSVAPAAPAATAAPETKATSEPGAEAKPVVTGAGAPSGSSVVHVVPGRMRYHVEGCKLLDGREDAEALTVDDAKDEGFSACSRCAGQKVLTTQA